MAQSLDPVSISFYDSCSNLSLGMCGNLLRKVESSISVECPTMSVCLSSLSVNAKIPCLCFTSCTIAGFCSLLHCCLIIQLCLQLLLYNTQVCWTHSSHCRCLIFISNKHVPYPLKVQCQFDQWYNHSLR